MNNEHPSCQPRWPIVRVVPGHDVQVELLSSEWVRLCTHWVAVGKGKTVLCPEVEGCELCAVVPARPYWYLPCRVGPHGAPALLELSSTTSADLEQQCRFEHGRVEPGIEVRLTRKSAKKPCRCEVGARTSRRVSIGLSEWFSPLMAIFSLDAMRPGEDLESYGSRVSAKVLERAQLAATWLREASRGSRQSVGAR